MATKLADTKSDNQTLAINTHPVTETKSGGLIGKGHTGKPVLYPV